MSRADAIAIVKRVAREQVALVVAARAELAQAAALLAGWSLITLGVAHVARPDVVWPVSAGAFLLAIVGVKFLADLFWAGLYQLARRTDA